MLRVKKVSLGTATGMVIANMIGTGVYTSLGFQLASFSSAAVILALWIIGGLIALFGSFAYAELACRLPGSGGEYRYMTKIYGRPAGFLTGWISVVAAFAAPIAAASYAGSRFLLGLLYPERLSDPVYSQEFCYWVSSGLILALTVVNLGRVRFLEIFQNVFVVIKLLLILGFVVVGFAMAKPQDISFLPHWGDLKEMLRPEFAISLVFVGYAFSGWNAATYIANEVEDANKNLPRALIGGTLVVTVLYVLLNALFLYSTPESAMRMKEEVTFIVAQNIFGKSGGNFVSGLIALGLVSAVSSLIWAGSRVGQAMGQDLTSLRFLAKENGKGRPYRALCVQAIFAIVFLGSMSFERIMYYLGFLLSLSTFFTVLGLFILRMKDRKVARPAYEATGFPWTPFIFLCSNVWILGYLIIKERQAFLISLATLGAGYLFYLLFEARKNRTALC